MTNIVIGCCRYSMVTFELNIGGCSSRTTKPLCRLLPTQRTSGTQELRALGHRAAKLFTLLNACDRLFRIACVPVVLNPTLFDVRPSKRMTLKSAVIGLILSSSATIVASADREPSQLLLSIEQLRIAALACPPSWSAHSLGRAGDTSHAACVIEAACGRHFS